MPTTVTTQPTTEPKQPGVGDKYEELDPGSTWVVSGCNSYISLRKRPYTTATRLAKIPKGETVEVLGWYGKFAKVSYNGLVGYALSGYIRPADETYMENALDEVQITDTYTYDDMVEDLIAFEMTYPDLVELEIAGYSELGTQIPVIRIGNPDAQYHVLLHGSIHAREHMTTWLLMAMADYWLDRDLASYGDVCYHIIPMVNPDGVAISQSGVLPEELLSIYQSDLKNGYTSYGKTDYARQWKANGVGVDLNRNFPEGWELIDDRIGPSSERYQGTEPFCAAEAQLLRDYTQRYPFAVTISYHATGSVIYYEYGSKEPANSLSEALGNTVSELTGYDMLGSNTVDGAGYKDWAINSQGIPSLTMEIGCETIPVAERELYSIFVRNCDILPTIAQWLQR